MAMPTYHDHSMDMNLSKLWEIVEDRETWHAAVHGAAKSGRASLVAERVKHLPAMQETGV